MDSSRKDDYELPGRMEEILGSALPLVILTLPFESPGQVGEAGIAYVNSNLLADLGSGPEIARQPGTNTLAGLLYSLAEDAGAVDSYLRDLRSDFLVKDRVIPFRGPRGERRVVQASSRILGIVGGDYTMQGFFHDITPRHDLEEKLLDQQRLIHSDLDLAGWVQRSLIPNSLCTRDVTLEVHYVPAAQVAGDYVDFQFVGPKTLYLSVCDVTGHGIAAALIANRVNSEVGRWIGQGVEPVEILRSLNRFFRHHFSPRGLFLSTWIGRLDIESGDLDYAGAGHPPPMIVRTASERIDSLEAQYPLVGVVEHLDSRSHHDHAVLEKDDKLILYTDGLFEVFGSSGALLGVEGLRGILRRGREKDATELSALLVEEVETFRERPRKDDVSFLIVEMASRTRSRPSRWERPAVGEAGEGPAEPGEEEFGVSIPSQARYLRPLRAMLSRVAQEIDFPEVETRELILSIDEACSNIIKHAYKGAPDGRIDLSLQVLPDALVVEIRDQGERISPTEIQGRELQDVKPGGLGTHFMRCCMDRVEFDTSSPRGNILRMTKRRS